MCQFGNSSKIISELDLTESEALIGYRSNYITNVFNNNEKFLKSINQDFIWNKKEIIRANPTKENSKGIYSYKNYYNHNNYNYHKNYSYNYYNYKNYYNSYYYSYNYKNYSYGYNNFYTIELKIKLWGRIFSYNEGYRSEFVIPTHLVILDRDSEWFTDSKTIEFANHINQIIENLAKEYDCNIIEFKDLKINKKMTQAEQLKGKIR